MKGLMMTRFNPGRRATLSALLATPFLSLTAQAQGSDWPNRPVRVVVPWPPGGGADTTARMIFPKLAQKLGQPFAGLIEREEFPGPVTGSEDEMLDYIRSAGTTVYHPCGTNRMGADQRSVVDEELRVRGVQGLRVVDASVFPLVPSSNIHPAVLMLAERASDLIRRAA